MHGAQLANIYGEAKLDYLTHLLILCGSAAGSQVDQRTLSPFSFSSSYHPLCANDFGNYGSVATVRVLRLRPRPQIKWQFIFSSIFPAVSLSRRFFYSISILGFPFGTGRFTLAQFQSVIIRCNNSYAQREQSAFFPLNEFICVAAHTHARPHLKLTKQMAVWLWLWLCV